LFSEHLDFYANYGPLNNLTVHADNRTTLRVDVPSGAIVFIDENSEIRMFNAL